MPLHLYQPHKNGRFIQNLCRYLLAAFDSNIHSWIPMIIDGLMIIGYMMSCQLKGQDLNNTTQPKSTLTESDWVPLPTSDSTLHGGCPSDAATWQHWSTNHNQNTPCIIIVLKHWECATWEQGDKRYVKNRSTNNHVPNSGTFSSSILKKNDTLITTKNGPSA